MGKKARSYQQYFQDFVGQMAQAFIHKQLDKLTSDIHRRTVHGVDEQSKFNAWCCIVISRKICLMRWLTSPCVSFLISSLLWCLYVLHISLRCMCTKAVIRLLLLCSLQTPFGMLDKWKFSSSNITHLSRLGSSMIRWSKFQKAIGCAVDMGVGVWSNICKH